MSRDIPSSSRTPCWLRQEKVFIWLLHGATWPAEHPGNESPEKAQLHVIGSTSYRDVSSVFIPQKLTTVFPVAPQTLTLNINFVSRSLKHSFRICNLPITPYEESGSQEEDYTQPRG